MVGFKIKFKKVKRRFDGYKIGGLGFRVGVIKGQGEGIKRNRVFMISDDKRVKVKRFFDLIGRYKIKKGAVRGFKFKIKASGQMRKGKMVYFFKEKVGVVR